MEASRDAGPFGVDPADADVTTSACVPVGIGDGLDEAAAKYAECAGLIFGSSIRCTVGCNPCTAEVEDTGFEVSTAAAVLDPDPGLVNTTSVCAVFV